MHMCINYSYGKKVYRYVDTAFEVFKNTQKVREKAEIEIEQKFIIEAQYYEKLPHKKIKCK